MRRWSNDELATLRLFFGVKPMKEIARMVNRTIDATVNKAMSIGLHADALVQGCETIGQAARRYDIESSAMRRILAWAHIPGARILMNAERAKRTGSGIRRYYDIDSIDEAMRARAAATTPVQAEARMGVSHTTIRRWLREEGVPGDPQAVARHMHEMNVARNANATGRYKRRVWVIPMATIEEVVRRRLQESARIESLASAARRLGIPKATLGDYARRHGATLKRGKLMLTADQFDEILAKERARRRAKREASREYQRARFAEFRRTKTVQQGASH